MKHAKHSPMMKKIMARKGTPSRPMSGGMGGNLKARAAKAARKGGPGARRIASRLKGGK